MTSYFCIGVDLHLSAQLELSCLCFRPLFKFLKILQILGKEVLLGGIVLQDFVVDLKVTCRDYLKNGVPVVLEVEDVFIGLILSLLVSISLGGEESLVLLALVPLNQDSLPEEEMSAFLVLRH